MKKLLFLLMLACSLAAAQQITPGQSFVDGQRITAAQLTALVSQATINPAFITGQPQHNTNLLNSDILLLVTSGGVFQQITGSEIINNPAIFTTPSVATGVPNYATFVYYNPSNQTLFQIALTNLAQGITSNINVSNLVFAATNSGSTNILNQILPAYPTTPDLFSTNNQLQYFVWDTNGTPHEITLSNTFRAAEKGFITNFARADLYTNVFSPWSFGLTNTFTNAWGAFTNFPITNLFFTNAIIVTNTPLTNHVQTLTNTDTFPLFALSQLSNTTATLEALYQFMTNHSPAFISTNILIPTSAGVVANTNHGLGMTPRSLRWVLQCVSTDVGYAVGDELNVSCFIKVANLTPAFSEGANATSAFLIINDGSYEVLNKSSGNFSAITTNKWNAKCYAFP